MVRNSFAQLNKREIQLFKELNRPWKIQDFLETIHFNFERESATLMSPRDVIRKRRAHCLEGALLAAAMLWYHGERPLILDLKTAPPDDHHTAALFKWRGKWGAISKTNHAVLRYRDPVYDSPRELAVSYFHEYFLDDGRKTLRSYTVFNLEKVKRSWIADEKDIWYVELAISRAKHIPIIKNKDLRFLRRATKIERQAGKLVEWKRTSA